ncbi:hypothetical protein EJ05DRAFT_512027 [Pseudovirgaria hyperparasitica]|uniref:PLL-like beta propeller domain-containing protein n=1 Tax=Pseudovirgaria hyperparasitica TaxID=470096 RepID=A0A6A6W314_9PEZI|nr:uncharacterized protein EJ05DRAFT_512027 [Pseudovirgaria hyperparasitica]KAF2756350.1 hypothetical protein EJ05DRAFT_512027 [Pseudovirgaria hyperparasitica]
MLKAFLLPILALTTMAQVTNLGGEHRGNFILCSSGPNSANILSLDQYNSLLQRWNIGSGWSPGYFQTIGESFIGDISALDLGFNRANIIGRGSKNEAKHYYWNRDPNGNQGWNRESLGGQFIGELSIVSLFRNNRERVDVFGRDAVTNQILHKVYDGTKWSDWFNIGGQAVSSPTAVMSGDGRVDVFIRGHNNKVYHKTMTGTASEGWSWSPSHTRWNDIGGDAAEEIVPVSNGPNSITIFARDRTNNVNSRILTNETWGSWELQGEGGMYKPAAVAWNDKITLAAISHEGNVLWAKTSVNGAFGPWYRIGGAVAATAAPQLLWNGGSDVFAYTRNADASISEKKIPTEALG